MTKANEWKFGPLTWKDHHKFVPRCLCDWCLLEKSWWQIFKDRWF